MATQDAAVQWRPYAEAFTSPRIRAGAGERAPELTSCSAMRGWICPVQRGDPSLAGARARARLLRGWAVTDQVSGRESVTATRTLHTGRAFHARRSQVTAVHPGVTCVHPRGMCVASRKEGGPWYPVGLSRWSRKCWGR